MNNIKEILDKLSSEKYYIQHSYCRVFNYEANALLDYITNLQEENVNLKTKLRWKERRIDKANNKLQTMFDNGNEETILDDLLELKDILGE